MCMYRKTSEVFDSRIELSYLDEYVSYEDISSARVTVTQTSRGNMTTMKKKKRTPCSARSPIGKRHAAFLNALCHASKEQQKVLLRTADESLVKCICECALNVLHGVVALKKGVKNRLKKYKKVLRQLVPWASVRQSGGGGEGRGSGAARKRRRFNWRAKKRLIMQKGCGAFLPLLLAPIITSLVSRLFGGNGGGSSDD